MRTFSRFTNYILLGVFIVFSACGEKKLQVTDSVIDFNFDWKFAKGDIAHAQNPSFDDSSWRAVKLPHDWSVEESYTQENTAGATAFLPGGIGWYRKTFSLPNSAADKITRINFDGIYTNSEVWINGNYLGKRPYGYIPFYYDLTPYLKYGDQSNTIAVRADRSAYVDCRWYPGSGIYRHVRLETLNKVHLVEWGTTITTPKVAGEAATVLVENQIVNQNKSAKAITVLVDILGEDGVSVAGKESQLTLEAATVQKQRQNIPISNPRLWDLETPHLYTARTRIFQDEELLGEYTSTFGIRSISYDAQKGFFVNGEKIIFKGVCLHHDGGLVGAAVPIGVWERRLQLLKEAGVNAIRTAHNPPSEDFLDLCDRMGFLVQDEIFDEWQNPKDKRHNYKQQKAEEVTRGYTHHFGEWAERDIKNMVQRDKNHPSIVMWSIGNEIEWTYPSYGKAAGYWDEDDANVNYYYDEPYFSPEQIKKRFREGKPDNYDLAQMAHRLSGWIKEMDTTRPVTANLVIPSVSYFSGYTDALDIVGISYRQAVYDYVSRLYPEKLVLGTENWAQWHEWKAILENKNIQGIFLWTGIYYMGESSTWPKKGSSSGLLDFAGFETPRFHLFKSLWNPEPHIYMSTVRLADSEYELVGNTVMDIHRNEKYLSKWGWPAYNEHWNYDQGESTVVEVFTNCREVELFLNDTSLGIQKLEDNYDDKIMQWHVPFSTGELVAKGVCEDGSTLEYVLRTAGGFSDMDIKTDKTELVADGYDVAHIEVELMDKNGIPVRMDDRKVVFEIQGNYRLLGVDNGASDNVQDIRNNTITTANGRCLLMIQSLRQPGPITIRAKVGDIESDIITINSK
ncbi:MAG: sugar-binding domain-containing protein [Bacteroidota bacterium]